MKLNILLFSMVAAGGLSADIEWVDEHEPVFEEPLDIPSQEVFEIEEEILLQEEEKQIYEAETEIILEESNPEQYMLEESKESRSVEVSVVDFEIEETSPKPKETKTSKEEIEFVFHEAPVEMEENELAFSEELVPIAEVGPFSQFSMEGTSTKPALKKEKNLPQQEMIFFAEEGFYLSPKKVTNKEYESFIKATHHRPPPHWHGGAVPAGQESEPVVNVTYKDAFLYTVWVGKRLPKESELVVASKNPALDLMPETGEWTATPSHGKSGPVRGASHLTINSELSRITYHKVFYKEQESAVLDSHSYNNKTGFRTASQ